MQLVTATLLLSLPKCKVEYPHTRIDTSMYMCNNIDNNTTIYTALIFFYTRTLPIYMKPLLHPYMVMAGYTTHIIPIHSNSYVYHILRGILPPKIYPCSYVPEIIVILAVFELIFLGEYSSMPIWA